MISRLFLAAMLVLSVATVATSQERKQAPDYQTYTVSDGSEVVLPTQDYLIRLANTTCRELQEQSQNGYVCLSQLDLIVGLAGSLQHRVAMNAASKDISGWHTADALSSIKSDTKTLDSRIAQFVGYYGYLASFTLSLRHRARGM